MNRTPAAVETPRTLAGNQLYVNKFGSFYSFQRAAARIAAPTATPETGGAKGPRLSLQRRLSVMRAARARLIFSSEARAFRRSGDPLLVRTRPFETVQNSADNSLRSVAEVPDLISDAYPDSVNLSHFTDSVSRLLLPRMLTDS